MTYNIFESNRKNTKTKLALYGRKHGVGTFVIMSPENPLGNPLSEKENQQRCDIFTKELREGHFPYTQIKGKYGEDETSFIIFNMSCENAIIFSRRYKQESFIFAKVNSDNTVKFDYYQIQNKNDDYLKYDIFDTSIGFLKMDEATDYYSIIGDNFKFRVPFKNLTEAFNIFSNEIWNNCKTINGYIERLDENIENACSDKYTKKSQWLARCRLTGIHCKDFYKSSITENTEQLGFFFAPEKKLTKAEEKRLKQERNAKQEKEFNAMMEKRIAEKKGYANPENDTFNKIRDGETFTFKCVYFEELSKELYPHSIIPIMKYKYLMKDDKGNKYIWTTQKSLKFNETPFMFRCTAQNHLYNGHMIKITRGKIL